MSLSITKNVDNVPKAPYAAIKDAVLGTGYTLSLTFVGPTRARTLNKKYRGATYTPNVLSFPLDKKTGDIYICPQVAKREAKKFLMTYQGYVGYLFIHGLLHLKGYPHGATMERLEKKYVKQFQLK